MQPRQYSLSRTPSDDGELRISVKRIDTCADAPAGLVSNHLHAKVNVGDVVELSAPAGEFFLAEENTPVVLASAGIGITPLLAMLQNIAAKTPNRPVKVLHVDRKADTFTLAKEVREAVSKLTNCEITVFLTRETEGAQKCPCFKYGRPTENDIKALAPAADADVYICGPVPFMDAMKADFAAAGVPADKIHLEAFGTGNQS